MATKRWLKVYCLLEQMLISLTRFVIFMIMMMNDVFISSICNFQIVLLIYFLFFSVPLHVCFIDIYNCYDVNSDFDVFSFFFFFLFFFKIERTNCKKHGRTKSRTRNFRRTQRSCLCYFFFFICDLFSKKEDFYLLR